MRLIQFQALLEPLACFVEGAVVTQDVPECGLPFDEMLGATRFLGELQAPIGQGPGHVQLVAHDVEGAQAA